MTKKEIAEKIKEQDMDDYYELKRFKEAVINVLYMTYAAGNGGYCSDFGPVTLGTLLKYTGFDMKDRRIIKEKSGFDKIRKGGICP